MNMGEQSNTYTEPVLAETQRSTDKKCPECGGIMDFDPSRGMLACPYCGHSEQIQREAELFVAKELDFDQAEEDAPSDWGIATKAVSCRSCGAQTIYDANQFSGVCPYCGSNQVTAAADQNTMAPGGVLPFQIDGSSASQRFRSWIGRKFFCPKLAKESARPEAFQGMYIPYWTFDSDTRSRYEGDYGIDRRVKDKEGKEKTETDWHRTAGFYNQLIDDLLVCASERQNTALLSGLEPFDTTRTVEYRPEYMAGFLAERYSVRMKAAWEEARKRIDSMLKGRVEQKIRQENHADRTRNVKLTTDYRNITYKYLLLPVWISSFRYNDKIYHFMVNGQTGKVSGNTPVSRIKVILVIAAVIAVIALLIWLTGNRGHAEVLRETGGIWF